MLAQYQTTRIADFMGPRPRLEITDVPVNGSLLAKNCEFNPGSVATRNGFGPALPMGDPGVAIVSLFNWIRNPDIAIPNGNALAYFTPATQKARLITNLTTGTAYDLFTDIAAVGAEFVSGGTRLYGCAFDANNVGTNGGVVVGTNVAAISIDSLFIGPLQVKPTLTNTGVGSVTAGTHRVGYILASRNGFTGKLSPITPAGVLDTTSFIVAPGGKQITFSINTTWPLEGATIFPVMTTADNLAQYFIVPGISAGVPPGQNFTVNITIDIGDLDLKATGTDVTQNQNLLTQTPGGIAPFNPFKIVEYGQRMAYFYTTAGLSGYYISDPANPQNITADQHGRHLPGFRPVRTSFVLENVMYVLGPHWTYAERDNQQLPVQWPTAELVDGQIGALGPDAVTVSASTGMAWVAHTAGLFLFSGGRYSSRPISYYDDPTWKRINFAVGYKVQVKDDKDKQRVYVLAPLDGALTPTHILVYDYSNGADFESIKPSIWNIALYNPGAIEITQNDSTKTLELWTGNSIAGKILRQKSDTDALPYNDDSLPIDWQFETAMLPGTVMGQYGMSVGPSLGMVHRHYACHVRLTGIGTVNVTTYGLDRTKSYAWKIPIIASAAPGVEYVRRIAGNSSGQGSFNSEGASHRFYTNSANTWARLSAINHYSHPGPTFR